MIETNAAPGLDNYAAMEEAKVAVLDLYRRIFNELVRKANGEE